MSNRNERPQQLLPRVVPPADLADKIMAAVACEPAPCWENASQHTRSSYNFFLLAAGLTLCIVLVSVALVVFLPGSASGVISVAATTLAKTKLLVDGLFWLTQLSGKFVVHTAMLLRPVFSVIGSITQAGTVVSHAVGTGKVVGLITLLTVCVVAGQVWLWRLLSQTAQQSYR